MRSCGVVASSGETPDMAIRITVVVPLFDSMGHGNAFLFMHRTQFLRRMRPCIGVLDVLHV